MKVAVSFAVSVLGGLRGPPLGYECCPSVKGAGKVPSGTGFGTAGCCLTATRVALPTLSSEGFPFRVEVTAPVALLIRGGKIRASSSS